MLIILPLFAFYLLFKAAWHSKYFANQFRASLIIASVSWLILILFSVELLNLISRINLITISIFWGIVLITLSAYLLKTGYGIKLNNASLKVNLPLNYLSIWLLINLLFIGLCAFLSAPNNFDAMAYHLPRVSQWIQQESLAHFPTHNLRQLTSQPLSEYVLLHLQILSGSDRWLNLSQWFAFLNAIVAITLLAKQLGADKKAQIYSAIIGASLPVAILQGSSPKNDVLTSFLVLTNIYFLIKSIKSENKIDFVISALCTSLAFLVKATSILFLIPFYLIFGIPYLIKNPKQALIKLTLVLLSFLLINGGYFYRNTQLNGQILPGKQSHNVINENKTINGLVSNSIRNIASQFNTPSSGINDSIKNTVYSVHEILGLDINNPAYTFGSKPFVLNEWIFHEDNTGNFIHTLLYLIALILGIVLTKKVSFPFQYFSACLLGFLLFSFLLKWQPWGNRLLIPHFLLTAPLIGYLTSKIFNSKTVVILMIILLVQGSAFGLLNRSRPLLGKERNLILNKRETHYFHNKHHWEESFFLIRDYVDKATCQSLGIISNSDFYEYPLHALLKENKEASIKHVLVENVSKKYEEDSREICLVISSVEGMAENLRGENFIKTRRYHIFDIFEKDISGRVAKENILYHLKETFDAYNKLVSIENDQGQKVKVMMEVFNEASFLNKDDLNNFYPDLGTAIEEYLKQGLGIQLQGIRKGSSEAYNAGKKYLGQWETWHLKHQKEILSRINRYELLLKHSVKDGR